jgi:hypothetical protein
MCQEKTPFNSQILKTLICGSNHKFFKKNTHVNVNFGMFFRGKGTAPTQDNYINIKVIAQARMPAPPFLLRN